MSGRAELQECSNCRYQGPTPKMHPSVEDMFLCRRFPRNSHATETFVAPSDWCGEWDLHRGYAVPS